MKARVFFRMADDRAERMAMEMGMAAADEREVGGGKKSPKKCNRGASSKVKTCLACVHVYTCKPTEWNPKPLERCEVKETDYQADFQFPEEAPENTDIDEAMILVAETIFRRLTQPEFRCLYYDVKKKLDMKANKLSRNLKVTRQYANGLKLSIKRALEPVSENLPPGTRKDVFGYVTEILSHMTLSQGRLLCGIAQNQGASKTKLAKAMRVSRRALYNTINSIRIHNPVMYKAISRMLITRKATYIGAALKDMFTNVTNVNDNGDNE